MKLVDYDPEAEPEDDGDEYGGASSEEHHETTPKKATNNNANTDTKPKAATPQRPFWAVTESFSTSVVRPPEDDEPRGGRKRGQDERKYDDVFNELGIKKSSNR